MNFLKKIFLLFLGFFAFFNLLFSQPIIGQDTFLIVNSNDWKDVIAGGVYASQNNYKYIFILTNEQGEYVFSLLSNSKNQFYYYESLEPKHSKLFEKFSSLDQSRVFKQANLADYFAFNSKNPGCIIVGSDVGAEAVSVASYAVFKGWGLCFSTAQKLPSLIQELKSQNKEILVYGSIAEFVPKDVFVQKINTGSIYLDNLELLKRFDKEKEILQVVLTSGKTFEESIAKTDPVVLVGRTEPSRELVEWMLSKPKLKAVVFDGDADIIGAIQSLKRETGLAVLTKFGTGYSTDAKVRPNLVLALPSKNIVLDIQVPVLDYSSSSLKIPIKNNGNTKAYVQIAAELPNGKFISSAKKELEPNSIQILSLSISAVGLQNPIQKVTLYVYSSAEADRTEAIDIVEFLNVKIENMPPSQVSEQKQPVLTSESYSPSAQSSPFFINLNILFALIVLVIVIALYYYGKKKFKIKDEEQPEISEKTETKQEQFPERAEKKINKKKTKRTKR
ncbi:MAG: hypothetical protein N3D10_01915 [Candidatus Micrarchaeota archaeon]|nr:hypothetical protein [Candidatus Micrarchaeota archaeon]